MNVVTHALLPALLALPVLRKTRRALFYRDAGTVALAGALPDLVHPHLSLAARYASWSHSVFALAAFALLLLWLSLRYPRQLPLRLALLAFLAAGLHLFGDAVSGGIAFFRPLSGAILAPEPRWIPYRAWIWLDLACVLCIPGVLVALGPGFERGEVARAETPPAPAP